MSDWIWIPLGLVAAVWFFSLIEGWSDIGNLEDDEPEEP